MNFYHHHNSMSFYYATTEAKVTKQWRIENYWIEFSFNVEDLWVTFEWYLAKPKEMWQLAMLDSFNELMRESCYKFCEDNELFIKSWDKEASVTWPALYWSVMQILMSTINAIKERWDAMFIMKCSDTQLRKAKKIKEKKLEEIKREEEKTNELDLELAKKKAINEIKQQMMNNVSTEVKQVQQVQMTNIQAPKKSNQVSVNKDISNVDFNKLF